jgi:DNA invertase Pin-like site-specific DNA recombinase
MKPGKPKAALHRAVYTRVSTDQGLEQEFNSLANQREASEAYVKSQAHEGWRLIRHPQLLSKRQSTDACRAGSASDA